ncbi:hypothetical protein SCHPADRAFT_946053 [Schizopora paradoxa]|uniref:Uncharacterized protein n=1 Tax=Schizopora paradoxa TaxID=27342 RepID=A0A0H2RAK1_9AGAM|nr:hypothetical protein SCHPADRAFT_946053 [Schizopora paradoxa]
MSSEQTPTMTKKNAQISVEDVHRAAKGKDWTSVYGVGVMGAELAVDESFLANLLRGGNEHFVSCVNKIDRKRPQDPSGLRTWWGKYEKNILPDLAAGGRWKEFTDKLSSVSDIVRPRDKKDVSWAVEAAETAPLVPLKRNHRGQAKEAAESAVVQTAGTARGHGQAGTARSAVQGAVQQQARGVGNHGDANTEPTLVVFTTGCKACAENKSDCVGVSTLDRCWTCHRAKKSKCNAPASIPGNAVKKLGFDDFDQLPVPAMDTREGKIIRGDEIEAALRKAAATPSSGVHLRLHCRMQKGATLAEWYAWYLATPEKDRAEAIINGRVPGRRPGWQRGPQSHGNEGEVGGSSSSEDVEEEDEDGTDGDERDGRASRPRVGTTSARGSASPAPPAAQGGLTLSPPARATLAGNPASEPGREVPPRAPGTPAIGAAAAPVEEARGPQPTGAGGVGLVASVAGPALPQGQVRHSRPSHSDPFFQPAATSVGSDALHVPLAASQGTVNGEAAIALLDAIQIRLRRRDSPTPEDQIPDTERRQRDIFLQQRTMRIGTALIASRRRANPTNYDSDLAHLLALPAPGTGPVRKYWATMNREDDTSSASSDEALGEPMDVEEGPKRE